jgi:hypothetical protein
VETSAATTPRLRWRHNLAELSGRGYAVLQHSRVVHEQADVRVLLRDLDDVLRIGDVEGTSRADSGPESA